MLTRDGLKNFCVVMIPDDGHLGWNMLDRL